MTNPLTIRFSQSELLSDYWGYEKHIIQKFGQKEFIITKDGSVTFQEAELLSNVIHHQLRQERKLEKIGVGIFARDPREVIPCMLGVLKSNNYFIVLDISFPEATLLSMIEDAGIKIILTTNRYFQDIQSILKGSVEVINIDELEKINFVDLPTVKYSIDDVVQIMFTSGSTSKPKGVVEDYRYLIRGVYIKFETYHYKTTDKVIRLSSFSFAGPHVDVFAALVMGFSLCYHDVKIEGFRELPDFMGKQKATLYTSTATTFRSLASVLQPEDIFPTVRTFILAGEKRLRSDILAIKQHFPNVKEVRLGFASTETGFVASSMPTLDTVLRYDSLPSGLPHDDVKVFIWDPEGNTLSQGEEGEIVVHSATLARGYINQPELTRVKFIQDTEKPGWQYYRTGDLGKILPDGQLMHLGRLDNMIKIRGIRIELESLENLISSYPGIIHVASKVINDDNEMKRLACYFTCEDGINVAISDLRKYLVERLPIQQLPSYLIWLDKMPLTNSGKVSFEKLPLPRMTRPELSNPYIPASTDTEKKLIGIWEEQIGISGIGITDDFFDIGGDSLIGVIVFSEIEENLGMDLPVSTLLKAPTVRDLARIVDGEKEALFEDLIFQINQGSEKKPLFFIPGKGGYPTRIRHLARKMNPEIPVYAFQNTFVKMFDKLENQVENVASRYLQEIRKVHPKGIFTLVGESLGGKIAYEISQQLLKQGDNPPILIMLDTYYDESILTESRRNREIIPYFKLMTKKHSSIWFNADWEGKKEYFNFYKETFFEKASKFIQHKILRQKKRHASAGALDKYARIEQQNIKASQAYVAKHYPGKVILVKALRGIGANVPANGWDKVGIQDLVIKELDCYHGSMLFEPAVSQLARIIQAYISTI